MSAKKKKKTKKIKKAPLKKDISYYLEKVLLYAFCLFAFLFPLFIFYSYDIYFLPKLFLLFIFAIFLISVFIFKIIYEGKIRVFKTSLWLPLLGMIFIIILSSIFSIEPMRSLYGKYTRYGGLFSYLAIFTVFFLTMNLIRDKRWIENFLKLFVFSSVVVSLYGIAQFFGLDPLKTSSSVRFGRIFSTYGNPDFLAGILSLALVISVSFIFYEREKKNLLLFSGSSSIILLALIFTFTRSGWIASLVGMVFFLIFFKKATFKNRRRIIIALSLILLLLVLFFAFIFLPYKISFLDKIKASILPQAGSISSRLYIWSAALGMIKSYPLTGTGLETFDLLYPKYVNPEFIRIDRGALSDHPHNELLYFGASLGSLGIILYLTLLVWAAVLLVKLYQRIEGRERILFTGIFASLISYFIWAQISISNFSVTLFFFIFTAFALLLGSFSTKEEKKFWELKIPQGNFFRKNYFILLLILALVFLYFCWLPTKTLLADSYFLSAQEALSQKDYSKSLEMAKIATGLNPKRLEYFLFLGNLYRLKGEGEKDQGSFSQGEKAYQQAIRLSPHSFEPYWGLGRFYLTYAKLDMAEENLKKSLQLNPYYTKAYLDLGILWDKRGEFEQAISFFDKAADIDYTESDAFYNLGIEYHKIDNKEKSLWALKNFISLEEAKKEQAFRKAISFVEEKKAYIDKAKKIIADLEKD